MSAAILSSRSHRLPLLGLLLSLLLYVGGTVFTAGHAHHDEAAPADHSCTVCLLAAATVASFAAALSMVSLRAVGALFRALQAPLLCRAVVAARARSPPALLI